MVLGVRSTICSFELLWNKVLKSLFPNIAFLDGSTGPPGLPNHLISPLVAGKWASGSIIHFKSISQLPFNSYLEWPAVSQKKFNLIIENNENHNEIPFVFVETWDLWAVLEQNAIFPWGRWTTLRSLFLLTSRQVTLWDVANRGQWAGTYIRNDIYKWSCRRLIVCHGIFIVQVVLKVCWCCICARSHTF